MQLNTKYPGWRKQYVKWKCFTCNGCK
jgi:hypothetical protein